MNPREAVQPISVAMNAAIIGQEIVIERLLIALLADGHIRPALAQSLKTGA
jgi:MoxR-like ATPase